MYFISQNRHLFVLMVPQVDHRLPGSGPADPGHPGSDQAQIQVKLEVGAKPVGPGPDDPRIDPCSALVRGSLEVDPLVMPNL